MGRQIHFYMLPDDTVDFVREAQEKGPVVLLAGNAPNLRDTLAPVSPEQIVRQRYHEIYLWNRSFLPDWKREWIRKNPRNRNVAHSPLPLLEFDPGIATQWEGKPALVQGRLYGQFDPCLNKPAEFEKWYESIVRWIRKNYKKNPAGFGGYVAPAAYQFFLEGGYLLPSFLPPRTDVWLAEIGKQHQASRP